MAALFKVARNLPLVIAALVLIATTSSIAQEVTFTTIMPQAPYRFNSNPLYVNSGVITVTESTLEPTTFCTVPLNWTAPKNGTILVTWHYPGFYYHESTILPITGDVGFSMKANGVQGLLGTVRSVTNIANRGGGGCAVPPIVDAFSVTRGTEYIFELQYHAQNFFNCTINLKNNSSHGFMIDIKYIQ